MSIQIEHQTIDSADGTPIGFSKIGAGPAVVFVHGTLTSGNSWLQVATATAGQFTCCVMDRRGRGRSGDGADYSLDREIEDIKAVLDVAGPGAHLVGHSSGAIYALEAALRFPIGKLVLYEPPLYFQGPEAERLQERIRAKVESQQFTDAVSLFFSEEVRLPEEELSFLRTTPAWNQMAALAPTFVREWDAIRRLGPAVERYQELSMPTLLLAGTVTASHPSFATDELQDALPNARTVMLEGHGHGANQTAPDLVAEVIVDFLTT